jgi:hypothetical protein
MRARWTGDLRGARSARLCADCHRFVVGVTTEVSDSVNNSHPAAAYDVDGFDTSVSGVSKLHRDQKHVIR